jgi:hypothetical protein
MVETQVHLILALHLMQSHQATQTLMVTAILSLQFHRATLPFVQKT